MTTPYTPTLYLHSPRAPSSLAQGSKITVSRCHSPELSWIAARHRLPFFSDQSALWSKTAREAYHLFAGLFPSRFSPTLVVLSTRKSFVPSSLIDSHGGICHPASGRLFCTPTKAIFEHLCLISTISFSFTARPYPLFLQPQVLLP